MFRENTEVNYLRVLVLILIIGLFIYLILPWNIIFPKKPVENLTKIIIQKEYINVLITPSPDGKTYFVNEYQSGIRKLNRPFSWIRNNVSGLKNMKVTVNVYNYLMFDSLHWFNPTEYKYYTEYPEISNSKFLFVMVNIYMDDIIGDDTRLPLFNKTSFIVEINNKLYYSKDYPEQIRFKELEYTYNLNDDSIIQAFGQKVIYSKSSEYRSTAGEYSLKDYYLKGGISNAIDGYLIFEIPKNTNPEDIIISAKFYNFGSSSWILKT